MASLENDKKKVLGRGLASLIPEAQQAEKKIPEIKVPAAPAKRDFFQCDIEKIIPNTYQPRRIFTKEALEELAESIKIHGIIQPLLVRQRTAGGYELIAGERRWRAAQKAGLKQVPVVVRDGVEDITSLELAIIENIQREQLNCIEEALAYQQLVDEFQLSQEDVATKVGKNRATVANTLRLLKLPAVIREDLTSGKLTMGHARALLSLNTSEEQLQVREVVLKKKLSVRDTEKKVNELLREKKNGGSSEPANNVHLKALEDDLRKIFGTSVRIVGAENKGFIQINYATRNDLMRISDHIKGEGKA